MPDEVFGVIAMGGMIGVALTWIVCHYTFLCWKQWQATALVRGMLERGYKPHEITQLVELLGHRQAPLEKPIKQTAYAANY